MFRGLAVFALCLVVVVSAQDAPIWPTAWFGVEAVNTTTKEGVPTPFESAIKWYDSSIPALRQDNSVDGMTSAFIHIGPRLYQFFPAAKQCVAVFMGIGPLRPDWLVGAKFIGNFDINDTPSYGWDQDNHFYYAAVSSGRPTRIAAFDQSGALVQQDFVNYFAGPIDSSIFSVPTYCFSNTTRTITLKNLPKYITSYDFLKKL